MVKEPGVLSGNGSRRHIEPANTRQLTIPPSFEWREISISPHVLFATQSGKSNKSSFIKNPQPLRIRALLNNPESPLGGNKACKLGPHLCQAHNEGYRGVLGFGGAYSNFILSLALAGRDAGLATIGVIRGDEIPALPEERQSRVLSAAAAAGMQLHYVDRPAYRKRATTDMQVSLAQQFPDFLIVPEGGSSVAAARACSQLIPDDSDAKAITHWAVAAGSGATCAGIAAACTEQQKVIAVAVVADPEVATRTAAWSKLLISESGNPRIAEPLQWLDSSSSAGFGQLDRGLCEIINECFESSSVLLDPVYTVKVLHSLGYLAARGGFLASDRIALVHTGGLTGWLGMRRQWESWLSDKVLQKVSSLPWQKELRRNSQV